MITLKHTYQTILGKEQIENWIELKKREQQSSIKIKKFNVVSNGNTFQIKRRRIGRHQAIFPQVEGKYNLQGNKINIKIKQSIYAVLFFALFWIAIPIVFLWKYKATENAQVETLFSAENLISLVLIMVFLAIMTYIYLIRIVYKTRDWIEFELKLFNRM